MILPRSARNARFIKPTLLAASHARWVPDWRYGHRNLDACSVLTAAHRLEMRCALAVSEASEDLADFVHPVRRNNAVDGWPTISSAVYPYRAWAPEFHAVTVPSRALLMMASSEDSTTAASRPATEKGGPLFGELHPPRAHLSPEGTALTDIANECGDQQLVAYYLAPAPSVGAGYFGYTGLRLILTAISEPSFRLAVNSRPTPIGRVRGEARSRARCNWCLDRSCCGTSNSSGASTSSAAV